jgi:hypothetical protein
MYFSGLNVNHFLPEKRNYAFISEYRTDTVFVCSGLEEAIATKKDAHHYMTRPLKFTK